MSKDAREDVRLVDSAALNQEEIGHKRSPKRTQYSRGRSGNPNGRPKGAKGHAVILREVAYETCRVIENGKPRERTSLELVLLALRNHVASAAPRATRDYEKFQELFGPQEALQPLGYLVIPEPPPPEEFARLCKEAGDNLHEHTKRQMAEHEVRLERWKANNKL